MKNVCLLLSSLLLLSCGSPHLETPSTTQDSNQTVSGNQGITPIPIVVDFADILPGLACANGGVSLFNFYDTNFDSLYEEDETIIKTKSICNGINGTSASITLEAIATSSTCPQGGVKISSTTSPAVEVCNGINGLNGISGTTVTPVKFCPTDNSTFPEYGIMIGADLYAVYWGTTPASPNTPQSFLTKLIAGNYMSTGGNNCLFSVP